MFRLRTRLYQLSLQIDALFAWLKWPAAAAALLLLPGAGTAFLGLVGRIAEQPTTMRAFLLGCAAYGLLWWFLFRRSRFSFFLTLEHELTHAIFALATFHRVVGIRATFARGGQMQFEGRGNWLITIAPYFFPTAPIFLIALLYVTPRSWLPLADGLVGAAFAYHLTSTFRETHPGQTDLQQVGYLFAALLLPTANLLSAGAILAFAHAGPDGLGDFLYAVGEQTWNWAETLSAG